jgi:hypothetical protein
MSWRTAERMVRLRTNIRMYIDRYMGTFVGSQGHICIDDETVI